MARGRAEEKGGSGAAAGLGCSTAFVGGAAKGRAVWCGRWEAEVQWFCEKLELI